MIGYRCIACETVQEQDFSGYVCPACGSNLDIVYDYASLAPHFPAAAATASDIFDFSALLPVSRAAPFPLRIGATPLYRAERLGTAAGVERLYLKDETGNPSASIKDRASAIALQRAIETGASVVATASTGNAGSSLACLAAAIGVPAVVFVPASAPVAKLTQLLAHGATVLAVRGNYDAAFELCLAASSEFGWFNRNTGFNPFTREGKKTCVYEIWQALGGSLPDRIVVSAGDGNVLSGIWKGCTDLQRLGLIDRLPRVDAAQSKGSDAISRAVEALRKVDAVDWRSARIDPVNADTVADSIAVDQPRDGLAAAKAIIESGGEAVAVADEDILAAITEMASLAGVFPEPAAAAPLAALHQLSSSGRIGPTERVVLVVSGNGLKDIKHAAEAVPAPTVIEPSLEAVRRVIRP